MMAILVGKHGRGAHLRQGWQRGFYIRAAVAQRKHVFQRLKLLVALLVVVVLGALLHLHAPARHVNTCAEAQASRWWP